jgi:hypothetical protein
LERVMEALYNSAVAGGFLKVDGVRSGV